MCYNDIVCVDLLESKYLAGYVVWEAIVWAIILVPSHAIKSLQLPTRWRSATIDEKKKKIDR